MSSKIIALVVLVLVVLLGLVLFVQTGEAPVKDEREASAGESKGSETN